MHNYCIDKREEANYQKTIGVTFYAAISGSIGMDADANGNVFATEIAHGGEHSDDFDRWRVTNNNLPRDNILTIVRNKDLRRPIKLSLSIQILQILFMHVNNTMTKTLNNAFSLQMLIMQK